MPSLPDTILNKPLAAVQLTAGFVVVPNALTDLVFSSLKMAAADTQATRTAFVGRQGGAVPYARLARFPVFHALYHHPQFVALVQQVAQVRSPLKPLPPTHKHACSLLVYTKEGDSIPYHYDRNYFQGTTFTVLLTLVNQDASQLHQSANNTCFWEQGQDTCISTLPNSLVIMHGESVLHKATPLQGNERRTVLSMVYTTDHTQSPLQAVRQGIKDWSWGF